MGESSFELGAVLDAAVRGGLIHESDAAIVREVPSGSTQEIVNRLHDAFDGVSEGRLRAVLGQVPGLRTDNIEDFVTLVLEQDPGEALQRATRLFAPSPPALAAPIIPHTEAVEGMLGEVQEAVRERRLRPFLRHLDKIRQAAEPLGVAGQIDSLAAVAKALSETGEAGWDVVAELVDAPSILGQAAQEHARQWLAKLREKLGDVVVDGWLAVNLLPERPEHPLFRYRPFIHDASRGVVLYSYAAIVGGVALRNQGKLENLSWLLQTIHGFNDGVGPDRTDLVKMLEVGTELFPFLTAAEKKILAKGERLIIDSSTQLGLTEVASIVEGARQAREAPAGLQDLLAELPESYEEQQAVTDEQALGWLGRLAALYHEQGQREVFPDSLLELIGRAQAGAPPLQSQKLDNVMRLISGIWRFAQDYRAQHGTNQIPFIIYRGTRAVVSVLASRLPEGLLRQVMPHGFFDGDWFVPRSAAPTVLDPIPGKPFLVRGPTTGAPFLVVPPQPRPPSVWKRFRAGFAGLFAGSSVPAEPPRPAKPVHPQPPVRAERHSGGLSPPVLPAGLTLGSNRHVRGPQGTPLTHPLAMPIPETLWQRLMAIPEVLEARDGDGSPDESVRSELVLIHEGTLGLGTAIRSAFSLPSVPEVLIFRNDGAVFAFYESAGGDQLFRLPWKSLWLEEGRQPPEPVVQLAEPRGFVRIPSTPLPLFVKGGKPCVVFHVADKNTGYESLEAVYLAGGGRENIGGPKWYSHALAYPIQGRPPAVPAAAAPEPAGAGEFVLPVPEPEQRLLLLFEERKNAVRANVAILRVLARRCLEQSDKLPDEMRPVFEKLSEYPLQLRPEDWQQLGDLLKSNADAQDLAMGVIHPDHESLFLNFLLFVSGQSEKSYDAETPIAPRMGGGSGDPVFGVTTEGSMSEISAVPETGSRLARVTRGRDDKQGGDDTLGTRLAHVAASRGLGATAAIILRLSEDQLRALVRHSASWKEAAARRGFAAGIASSAQFSTITDRTLALLAIAAGSQQDLAILAGTKATGPMTGLPVLPFPGATAAAVPTPAPSLPLMLAR